MQIEYELPELRNGWGVSRRYHESLVFEVGAHRRRRMESALRLDVQSAKCSLHLRHLIRHMGPGACTVPALVGDVAQRLATRPSGSHFHAV